MDVKLLRWALEPRVLGLVAAMAAALWVFMEVAEEVLQGHTGWFDRGILLALRMPGDPATPLGPAWLQAVARDVTALGSLTVLGLYVLSVMLFLMLANKRRTAVFVLLATTSGALAMALMKEAFGRPRPDLFAHGDYVTSASFPSGHAMISAVVYLTLAALVARLMPTRTLKLYVLSVALFMTFIIGLSRVYLGVHWPTDVLAGWAAGAAWALAWWGIVEWFSAKARGVA
jgi:undecaprenyl-diphosphatase